MEPHKVSLPDRKLGSKFFLAPKLDMNNFMNKLVYIYVWGSTS